MIQKNNNYKLPFQETIENGYIIRLFDEKTNEVEFTWHRDREDRIIEATHETDWLFQIDNELPIKFDDKIFIKKMVWHRVIKGNGNLELKIKKLI